MTLPADSPPPAVVTTGGLRRVAPIFGIAIAVVLADQLTKWWAESALTEGRRVPLIGDLLGLQLVYNPGAAFSIGTQFTWVFAILAAVAAIGLTWYAFKVTNRWMAIAIGLLLGGAVTHLGDRLFREPGFGRGHVVDFIDYGSLFIGNVADIALVCGAITIVIVSLTARRAEEN